MREAIKQFAKIFSKTLPISEPIYEFGSYKVEGQENFFDLRTLFPEKEYVGCDMRKGPGVDKVLDLHMINLPDESVGTVIMLETLEHVEFFRKAIEEVYRILKQNGLLIMSSVMKFPIHKYPNDYWRFTPEGFMSLLSIFPEYFVDFAGDREFPHTVIGVAYKGKGLTMDEFRCAFSEWKRYWSPKDNRLKKFIKSLVPPIVSNIIKG